MTKKEAIKSLVKALAGDEAEVGGGTVAEAIGFLATCLSVEDGSVKFELPSDAATDDGATDPETDDGATDPETPPDGQGA